MIKNFLAICVLVLSFGAYAQSINVENLSPSQIAELNRRISDMKKDQVLQEYQYFVGNSQSLFQSEDGLVIPKAVQMG